MESIENGKVMVEIEENTYLEMPTEQALEMAVKQYFENGKCIKLNNKKFDIFNYGNYKEKLYAE
jgi:tRNA(Phe) wybutosine-synthesizing methylase Tyw3